MHAWPDGWDRFGSKNNCLPSHCLSVKLAGRSSAGSALRASLASLEVPPASVVAVPGTSVVPRHADAARRSGMHSPIAATGSRALREIFAPCFVVIVFIVYFLLHRWWCSSLLGSPLPVPNLRQILAVRVDVLLVLDELVLELLLQMKALLACLRQAVDRVHHKMEAVQIVQHRHVEGRRNG